MSHRSQIRTWSGITEALAGVDPREWLEFMDKHIQYPLKPDRFSMGDNRLFHSRPCKAANDSRGGPTWEVYSLGLEQWAECKSPEHAKVVRDALEDFYSNVG
jgi:hypothetical protein